MENWIKHPTFHPFTEERWQNISRAIGPVPREGRLRFNLEMRVNQFLKSRKEPRFKTVRERNAMKSVAALSKKLRKRLQTIDQRAWLIPGDNGNLGSLRFLGTLAYDLHQAEQRATEQAQRIKRKRGPTDPAKKDLWLHAIGLYEHFTGNRAGASNPSSGKGEAGGPCIRFLIALTLCVPNEKKPSGDQLRAVIRDYQQLKRKGWKTNLLGGEYDTGQTAA
jgi:hypothetical protein